MIVIGLTPKNEIKDRFSVASFQVKPVLPRIILRTKLT